MIETAMPRLLLVLALSTFAGCGAEAEQAAPKAPARELPPDVGSMLLRRGQEYGGPVVTTGGDQPVLRKAFEDLLPPSTRATVKHDPSLDLVAQVLAVLYLRTRQLPAISLEQWIFWRCGATPIPGGFDILHLLEPSARHSLLAPATTLLGLGVAPRPAGDRVRPWSVIEYAIEPVGPIDPAKEGERVYAELRALDTEEGKAPVERDDALGKVAQGVAEEICRGTRKLDDAKGIWDRARAVVTRPYTKAGSFSWLGYRFTRPEIARVREGSKGKDYTHVGVGMCQGDLPNLPKGTFVLFMMAG
jgi:hypothetical protein